MFPYLDLPGVSLRSILRQTYFDQVEVIAPGFTAQSIASHSSGINARMRKRYGKDLPWGKGPPTLLAAGLNPPQVSLQGVPTLGSLILALYVTTGGPLATAAFKWTANAGASFTSGVATAPAVPLGATGLAALFPAGTYDVSNAYSSSPPVPDAILRWVTTLVSWDVLRKHGPPRTGDDIASGLKDEVELVQKQIEDAANSQAGLWDLPASEDQGSAITTGGPRFYNQTSPYVESDIQAARGEREDAEGRGSYQGGR